MLPEMIQERREVPRDKWRARPGDKYGSRKVIGEPFSIKSGKGWVQVVEVECDCGSPRSVGQVNTVKRGGGCPSCAPIKNGKKHRKGSLAKNGWKRCCKCLKSKRTSQFPKDKNRKDGLNSSCRECGREKRLNSYYGENHEIYDNRVKAQDDKCAICKRSRSEVFLTFNKWSVDHDHKTGMVRGLLCKNCNFGLGYFKDDPVVLQNAIDYLKEHELSKLEPKETGVKRYLLFGGSFYYPEGGWGDLIRSFDSFSETMEFIEERRLKGRFGDFPFDWFHILDAVEWKIVQKELETKWPELEVAA